ncbi:MAG: hypothetical protein ACK5SQ_07365 [Chitinophagales bacterium]|jgi:hypothetical protein
MKYNPLNHYWLPGTVLLGGSSSFLGAPWWIGSIVGFIAAYFFPLRSGIAFFLSFISSFILWSATAFFFDFQNEHQLSTKMGTLLGGANYGQLIFLTGFIGGLLSGIGSWMGILAKKSA